MAREWLRRAWLLAACAASVLVAACGSGSIDSQLTPARILAFGDGFADLGQNGREYTVNDGSLNNWTEFVAVAFGRTLTASSLGGTSYAIGNARVVADTDAAGNTATPSVREQIDAYIAAGGTFRDDDLVIVNAGTSDVIAEVQAVLESRQTRDQMLASLAQTGRDLGAQVRRLVEAGATHVVVVGPYNLGRSPWSVQTQQGSLMLDGTGRFNDQMLVSIVDLGANVLYVDAALYLNLVTSAPSAYELSNGDTAACTSVDPGPGIGTGANQVNANLCTTSTLLAGISHDHYLFADRVYITPRGHRLFGEYAHNKIRERW